jgi:hypothetical protein
MSHTAPGPCHSANARRKLSLGSTLTAMQFSLTDAAHVLGMLPWEAEEILGAGPYELDAVEKAALEHYRSHAHARDPYSYWVTTTRAAAILGISDVRVKQLLNAEKIPFQAPVR